MSKTAQNLLKFNENFAEYSPREKADALIVIFEASQRDEALKPETRETVQHTLQGMFTQTVEEQLKTDPYLATFICTQEGSSNLCQGIEGDAKAKLTTVLETLETKHASHVVKIINNPEPPEKRLEGFNALRACVELEAVTVEDLNEAGIAQELAVMKGAFSTGAPATADTPQARFEDVGLVM